MVETRSHTIPTIGHDGLAATVFRALPPGRPGPEASDVLIVNAAMAVPARFYHHFAAGMAGMGFTAVTWDYRDVGASASGPVRRSRATIEDWLADMDAVIEWTMQTLDTTRVSLVGHSLGGQVAGMLEHSNAVSAMVTVSSQSGHWRFQGGHQKYAVAVHGYLTLPLLPRLLGYLPWSWFGAVDLPSQIALRWGRWVRSPEYLFGDPDLPLQRYSQFSAPVLAYSVDDDDWGSARAVDLLMSRAYANLERRHLVPRDAAVDHLGHMGFFRPHAAHLWRDVADWIRSR